MTVSYPLDISGVSPANLVVNELHTSNEAQFRDYHFIVPNLAPFYIDNFQMSLVNGNVTTLLTEDVDFSFALSYVTGTRHTGKQMYGAITLHNLEMNGFLKVTYQTVGGDQVANRLEVLTVLADKAYNPRTTIWDVLTNVPNAFPPVPHYQDYEDFKGQEAVVLKLAEIRDAILANSSLTSAKIEEFFTLFNQGDGGLYVHKSGDEMSGPLELKYTPQQGFHAVNKTYVDETFLNPSALNAVLANYINQSELLGGLAEKLNFSGGVMTGPLSVMEPTEVEHATRKDYVDNLLLQQASQIEFLQQQLQTLSTEKVGKAYVDDLVSEVLSRVSAVGLQRT